MENKIHSFPGFAKGLRPRDLDRAHLKFGDFLTGLPIAPLVNPSPALNYPMDGNDQVGCCVVAGWDHYRQIVTQLLTGNGLNFTQDQIWAFYKTQNPNFDPNGTAQTNGPGSSSDNGMDIQMFLEYLQQNNLIVGFASIDYTNPQEMRAAIYIGLSIITGVTLQEAQMQQFGLGIWSSVPGSPIDGGHCVPGSGDVNDEIEIVSWAKVIKCDPSFISKQMNQAWFVITQYHIDHPNFRDNFDLEAFAAAVYSITQGKIVIPVKKSPAQLFSRTLKEGMSGSDVSELQSLLNMAKVDGVFGAKTLEEVILFQTLHNLVPDGVVGAKTQAILSTLIKPKPMTYSKSFTDSVNNTLGYEGGLTQDPNDPGGTTNWGISQRSYPKLNIANLTKEQAIDIYHSDFWVPIKGDSMPECLAMNVFDCAVNCGVGEAIKMMQGSLGVIRDGNIGDRTLAAMAIATPRTAQVFENARELYYESLAQFNLYGSTWIARSKGTLAASLSA